MIHHLSEVKTKNIGKNSTVWQYSVILEGALIGDNCNINCHTFIENDVVIGNSVTIKSGVYLWDGIFIEDDVFVGPNVTFTNDPYPKSKQYPLNFQKTLLKKGCSIGANATILGGIIIGENSLVGAGSVVTKNVSPNSIIAGNPAKIIGWVNNNGEKLIKITTDIWEDSNGFKYIESQGRLVDYI